MWQTKLGHLFYQNDTLAVLQNTWYRWMVFPESHEHTHSSRQAVQTLINRYAPKRSALAYIPAITLAFRSMPHHTCLLGLGGGGIAHALSDFTSICQLTAVECSAAVIEAAYSHFMLNRINNLHIHQQDAYQFLQQSKGHYQHIIIDIADSEGFPQSCCHQAFFKRCYDLLPALGTLSINIINPKEQAFILTMLRRCFGLSTLTIPIPRTTNVIVIAYKHHSLQAFLSTLTRQKRLKRLIWHKDWGYMAKLS